MHINYILRVKRVTQINTKMRTLKQVQESKQLNILFQVLKRNPSLISPIKVDDVIKGEMLFKDSQKAFFELEGKNVGIIYGVEFLNATDIIRGLKIGDSAKVTVLEDENEDGYAEISLIKALRQQSWQKLNELKKSGNTIKIKIKSANSGGLVASVNGIKAFLPVSQLSVDKYPHVEDGNKSKILKKLEELIGEELEVNVIDVDHNEKKLILSEREVKESSVKDALSKYKEGDDVDVVVSGVADFGAFVRLKNNPDIEGLVHISELDHKLIESPRDVVNIGDEVKAKIIEIKNGRISLSFKALKENPWDKIKEYFSEGQEVKGRITKIEPFGSLAYIGHDLQGLIHISEFESAEKMAEKLQEGKEYTFIISKLNPEEKRIILKLNSKKS